MRSRRTNNGNEIWGKLPFGILAASVLIAPFLYRPDGFDFSRLTKSVFLQIIGITLLGLIFLRRSTESTPKWRLSRFEIPILLFLGWAAMTFFWATNLYSGLDVFTHWITSATFFFIAVQLCDDDKKSEIILLCIAIAGTGIALLGCVQYWFGWTAIPQSHPPAATFGNRNMAAHVVVFCAPSIWFFILRAKRALYVGVYGFMMFLMGMYVVKTASRAAFVALASEIMVFTVLLVWIHRDMILNFFKRIKSSGNDVVSPTPSRMKIGVVSLFVVFIVISSFFSRAGFDLDNRLMKRMTNVPVQAEKALSRKLPEREVSPEALIPPKQNDHENKTSSVSFRLTAWRSCLNMVRSHPFLGVGLGNFMIVYPKYREKNNPASYFDETRIPQRAHNDYIQLIAELGLPGFTLFLLVVVLFLSTLCRNVFREKSLVSVVVFSVFVGMSIVAFFSFPMEMAIAPFFAVLLASTQFQNTPSVGVNRGIYCFAFIASFLILLLVLFVAYYRFKSDRHYFSMEKREQGGDWNGVVYHGQKVLRYYPFQTLVYGKLGKAYGVLGKYDQSRRYLEILSRYYPYWSDAWFGLATLSIKANDYPQALEYLKKAVSLSPESMKIHNTLGIVYGELNDYEKALGEFETAITREPANAIVWLNLGRLHLKYDNPVKAKRCFIRALIRDPDLKAAQILYERLRHVKPKKNRK